MLFSNNTSNSRLTCLASLLSASGNLRTRGGIYYTPRVDIYETADEVALECDMPGVKPQDVDVRFEKGELSLNGKVLPRQIRAAHLNEEYCLGDFCRSFAIAPEIDATKISAEYRDGVLTVHLSNTLDVEFCLEALDDALTQGCPEVFNTDQGVQYTSASFTGRLELAGAKVSMDGKGRCLDNVFVERLWRTVKYEYVYLWRPEAVPVLARGLTTYFGYYNDERSHQSLEDRTPAEVYGRRSRSRKACRAF
jgi:transposase InsO family protein